MGVVIGKGHVVRGLHYLEPRCFVSCFASSSPKLYHVVKYGSSILIKLKKMVP